MRGNYINTSSILRMERMESGYWTAWLSDRHVPAAQLSDESVRTIVGKQWREPDEEALAEENSPT
jgi:hypothetical protein